MPTTPFTIRLDDDARQALEREAKLEERPAAQLAARAIATMLEAKAAKRAAIDAALTEAEAGQFISEEAMSRWIESWGTDNELPEPEADVVLR